MQPSIPIQTPISLLSEDRLGGYRVEGGPNGPSDLLGRYLNNLAVSYALYPALHTLEVLLRNRIYDSVARDHPIDPDRPDLYDDFPCWLDGTPGLLIADHVRTVQKAKDEVRKDLRRRLGDGESRARRHRTPGRLVAKLTLAFWVFLFDSEYCGSGRGDVTGLWPRYFDDVFPHRTGSHHVVWVRKALRRILVVRNRCMHFERITPWSEREGHSHVAPTQVLEDIETLVSWMSPFARDALVRHGPDPMYMSTGYERFLRRLAAGWTE